MVFNSFNYYIFLPLVYIIYYAIGDNKRWTLLLLASIAFYAALGAPYLLIVLSLVIISTYLTGIYLDGSSNDQSSKTIYWIGVCSNIIILAVMKYLPFVAHNLSIPLFGELIVSKTLLSIGVSYFVFQSISYLTDIYLGIEKAEKHLGYFALYISFFPKLLQGPIERVGDLLPQLKKNYKFDYNNIRIGMLLFAWGLFKKAVIADRLALYVNPVFDDVHRYKGIIFIIVTYLYALQIYFDFSGYTDMALGTACVFNIKLTQNFNMPYMATSIADFWRRWHISFSRWILDYIFRPLQMYWRDIGAWGTSLALIVTFFISGIWHGTSWGFIFWGLLHGLYLAVSVFYKPKQKWLHAKLGLQKTIILKIWQIIVTFNLVCFAWIFFRANNIENAWYIITNALNGSKDVPSTIIQPDTYVLIYALSLVAILNLVSKNNDIINYIVSKPLTIRWAYYFILTSSILILRIDTINYFIYFQF